MQQVLSSREQRASPGMHGSGGVVAGEGVTLTGRHGPRGLRPNATCSGLSELSHLEKCVWALDTGVAGGRSLQRLLVEVRGSLAALHGVLVGRTRMCLWLPAWGIRSHGPA